MELFTQQLPVSYSFICAIPILLCNSANVVTGQLYKVPFFALTIITEIDLTNCYYYQTLWRLRE